jgi:dolichyl-phosphate mannosyltransferase polypeptide 3
MGLLRYQIFLSYGALFLGVWYQALNWRKERKDAASLEIDLLLTYAPVWAVLILGIYALSQVLRGVMVMSDCPEASKEIEQQVKEARVELKKRGIQ